MLKDRRMFAEFFGSMFLLLVVIGSGIMGEELSQGNNAIALLANSIATGGGLFVLISVFGPVSGAHFNPVVSTYFRIRGQLNNSAWLCYVFAQISGSIVGVTLTHFIFAQPIVQVSAHVRDGLPLQMSEFIATLGLLFTIVGFSRFHPTKTAVGVAAYIVGAYWFTSSTSFANPAVTIARSLTDTFAGIAPRSLIGFLLAQGLALLVFSKVEKLAFAPVESSAP